MTPDQVGLVIADRFLSEEYSGRDNLALHISSAINQAMADERERCAKVAESYQKEFVLCGHKPRRYRRRHP
jgi:hypothetical protein